MELLFGKRCELALSRTFELRLSQYYRGSTGVLRSITVVGLKLGLNLKLSLIVVYTRGSGWSCLQHSTYINVRACVDFMSNQSRTETSSCCCSQCKCAGSEDGFCVNFKVTNSVIVLVYRARARHLLQPINNLCTLNSSVVVFLSWKQLRLRAFCYWLSVRSYYYTVQ